MDKTKIVSIQYLRGLAALGVVFCHFGSDISSIFNFGQTGVYVFFLISGFIIVYSLIKAGYTPTKFFTFLLKRSIRIDPAYYATILLTIVLFKLLSYIPTFKGSVIDFVPGQLLAHVFYVVPFTKYPFYNHVFWTLCVEFQFYLLIGLIYFLSKNPAFKSVFLILFSLSSLIPFSNSYYLVFTYAPIFALGISLVTLYQKRSWLNTALPIFLLSMIAFKFGASIFILLLFSCIAIFYFNLVIKPLSFLGDISYSLYLTHPLTFIVFTGTAKRLHFDLNSYLLFWLFIELSLAILFAYIFYLLIEKPSLRLSKHIFYKKTKDSLTQTHLSLK
ncbi:MAG TPA: acyltransferase [Mucilaginibacter sp.]|jgi:peptidoglycan/LPS O-acetylase OafA/YrhL